MTGLPPTTHLPVEDAVEDVGAALARTGVAVLQAPPGAGKTTVVPLRLLGERWVRSRARIVVLEPRRLAARAAARRMSALLGEEVGHTVGYATRDERVLGPATRVEVVTEGILTRRLQRDRKLPGTDLLVFDEVHERNLHTDLAMALALDVRRNHRPDLRLLAMSATAETAPLSRLLGTAQEPAPVIVCTGRQHPVTVRWAPPPPRQRQAQAVSTVVGRALREQRGDVLVFLAGAADIRRAEGALRPGLPPGVDVRGLFGALSPAEQDLALAPSPPGRRRVVLSTDIAETSLTVEGVTTVVDAGQARRPQYDARTGLTRLRTVTASRSSAEQRAGRAGRTGPGATYRLWSKVEHASRRPFPLPEIFSVDLSALVLELALWGRTAEDLPFLDHPPPDALARGSTLLRMLGALDDGGRITAMGRDMAELPVHPRLSRMVLGAVPMGCGWEACLVAALLEERDVLRGHPDDLPTDLVERLTLVSDIRRHHPSLDPSAARAARRRAEELARRVGVAPARPVSPVVGPVRALAYPDRIGRARGNGRFRMSGGGSAWVPRGDTLAGEEFLVAAQLDADRRDSRVRIAAALDAETASAAAGGERSRSRAIVWDDRHAGVREHRSESAGHLELSHEDRPAQPGEEARAALLEHVRSSRLAALPWTQAARGLQQRAGFARRTCGQGWPDLSDEALIESLDAWLAPCLAVATSARHLAEIDLVRVLEGILGPDRRRQLDTVAPEAIRTDTGRRLTVDYSRGEPSVAVRMQEMFGTVDHPRVAGGLVPIRLELLSPANRPLQVTTDIAGFWSGSYVDVRREMAGRYPKHDWPADPAAAAPSPAGRSRGPRPPRRRKPRRGRR